MTIDWKRPAIGLAATAVLFTGILASMVVDRVMLLRSGKEIVLPIRPVDPRDLFKGDFVRLGYDISQPKDELLKELDQRAGRVHVTLSKATADSEWQVAAVSRERPASIRGGEVVLAAKLEGRRLMYGLERYFVPEGTGLALEDRARTGKLSAVVAVDAKGRSAIKGLVMDGKTIYDEPLL